ncbi:MAG: hypothetical protein AAFP19_13385, partial [Bacteroidota bacterium]
MSFKQNKMPTFMEKYFTIGFYLGVLLFFASPDLHAGDPDIPGLIHKAFVDRAELEPDFIQNGESMIMLVDPNWDETPATLDYGVKRTAIVNLVYSREDLTDIAGEKFWYEISYELQDADDNLIGSGTLQIKQDESDAVYEQQERFLIGDIVELHLKITDIKACLNGAFPCSDPAQVIIPEPTTDIATDIRVELAMAVQKYYEFAQSAPGIYKQDFYTYQQESRSEVAWSFMPGAEEYELEYFFWDREMGQPDISESNMDEFFRNAVRINTWKNWYALDLSYPEGWIFYRVRAVGRFIQNVNGNYTYRKYGQWSTFNYTRMFHPNNPPVGDTEPFEYNYSWQFTTEFSEDGKSKKTINYYDETMRSRQAVTYMNDAEIALVAESDYTIEGDNTLGIQPAPAGGPNDHNLFFKPAFNKAVNPSTGALEAYNFYHFDRQQGATGLSNSSGAGQYYSSANTSDHIHRDYVPDANGFPFTHQRKMRDKRNRLHEQGMLGEAFQLGGGRETKHFYLTASETELRRLFGKNVGLAEHYVKQVLIDGNGQA